MKIKGVMTDQKQEYFQITKLKRNIYKSNMQMRSINQYYYIIL